jgi:hypothetical protein
MSIIRWNCKTSVMIVLVLSFVIVAGTTRSKAQPPRPPSPLTLQQAIQYAINNYPAIQASRARVAAEDAGVDLARMVYLPRLNSAFQINRATRNNVAGLLLPGASIPAIHDPDFPTIGHRRLRSGIMR